MNGLDQVRLDQADKLEAHGARPFWETPPAEQVRARRRVRAA